MADIKNAESVRTWFRNECPAIHRNIPFYVDYFSGEPVEYGIFTIPSVLRTKENILGEEIPLDEQEQSFFFAANLTYGADVPTSNENLAFFQDITTWIYKQNEDKNFPDWDGGRIKSIVPSLTVDISRVSANTAEYRIQLKITYRRI